MAPYVHPEVKRTVDLIVGRECASRASLCFIVESGTDVRLVEGIAERFDLTVLARRIPEGVEVSQVPNGKLDIEIGPASRLWFVQATLRRLVFGKRFDVILVQGYSLSALAANVVALVRRVPAFMLVCSPIELYYRCRRQNGTTGKVFRAWEYLGIRLLARINAKLGRHYIVLSQHLADVVRGHGTRASIDLVPVYGVDTTVFHPATAPPSVIRQQLGLPPNGAMVFYSSRVAPEKDSQTLLKAFSLLLQQGRDLWLLHRSGAYRELLNEARRFGVSERIIATDAKHPLTGLAADYQGSDLCVQASREEGLGFSPLEALACGVPVVAAAVGGLRESIVEGVTGWTYPVGDADALARAISAALDDPEESRRRAQVGRRLVAERYERTKAFSRLERLLLTRIGARGE